MAKDPRRTGKTTDRVNITADVQVKDGTVKVKVPFVTGVLSSLSGAASEKMPPVEDREFLDFDQQNFEKRMEAIGPTVECNVKNKIDGDGELQVKLQFKSMKDFEPGAVVKNVDALRRLAFVRGKLKEMLANSSGMRDREQAVKALFGKLEKSDSGKKLLEQMMKS